jgi:hypothetical protein
MLTSKTNGLYSVWTTCRHADLAVLAYIHSLGTPTFQLLIICFQGCIAQLNLCAWHCLRDAQRSVP